jgi:putative hemolysin
MRTMEKEKFMIPMSRNLLDKELTSITLAREWRGFEIHFIKKSTQPNVLVEVNRISTIMFNLDKMDGDVFDDTYTYIVVYDRINGEIISFYRYILCRDAIHGKRVNLSTAKYFKFSHEFVEKILPKTIEFGRSVVNKTAKNHEIGLQAVWAGLGILVYEYHQNPRSDAEKIEYFFGKFSLQRDVYRKKAALNMILYPFQKHFPPALGSDGELFVLPKWWYKTRLSFVLPKSLMKLHLYKEDRKILVNYLQTLDLPMPKLADTYANVGGLAVYATITNRHLDSYETAILQKINEIDAFYIRKFVDGYIPINKNLFV